jgi:hypothetical protein
VRSDVTVDRGYHESLGGMPFTVPKFKRCIFRQTEAWIFLSPCFCLSGSLVALGSFAQNVRANPPQLSWRPFDEKHGVKKMGTKR